MNMEDTLFNNLYKQYRNPDLPHAPKRVPNLSEQEKVLAVNNALRYFPLKFHDILYQEFEEELEQYGHIYMYRFKPDEYQMKAYPFSEYNAKI